MTANHDETDRILEQIDRAVSDFSVSADAMRSIPAGQEPPLPGPLVPDVRRPTSRMWFLPEVADVAAPRLADLDPAGCEEDRTPPVDITGVTFSYQATEEPTATELLRRAFDQLERSRGGSPYGRHAEDCPSQQPATIAPHPDDPGVFVATFTICEGCS